MIRKRTALPEPERVLLVAVTGAATRAGRFGHGEAVWSDDPRVEVAPGAFEPWDPPLLRDFDGDPITGAALVATDAVRLADGTHIYTGDLIAAADHRALGVMELQPFTPPSLATTETR